MRTVRTQVADRPRFNSADPPDPTTTGQFLYWLADCPLTLSGLSAIHPRQTSRDNDASGKILNSTADRPAPLGGPSAVHSANSPEPTTSLDKILDSTADCPALLGGPSAVHPCEPHQTISSLDKLRSLRRTVRSPIVDRPQFNSAKPSETSLDNF